jgi:Tfp pilus assembly protein PilF
MKLRPIAVSLLVTFTPAALVTPNAWAQTATEEPTTSMARARFREGVEFYDKGQFELARAAFLQAYALKKHPAVLLNLAWSCLKAGHPLEAERYFRQFLSEGKEITDRQRADANDGLAQARAKLGHIEVAAAAGTEITIDGEAAGVAPLADAPVAEAGAHTVKMRAPDGAQDTQSVTVTAGEKAVVRFARIIPPAPAPAAGPPAPAAPAAAAESPLPEAPPPSSQQPSPVFAKTPAAAPEHEESHANTMSVVPLIVGGALVLVAGGVAIGFGIVAKNSAQDNADSTGTQIANYETVQGIQKPSCDGATLMRLSGDPSNASSPRALVTNACTVWNNDNSTVNEDATVGNIALGVGIAAAAGTLIYGIIYATHSSGAPKAALVPMVDRSTGGLLVLGSF